MTSAKSPPTPTKSSHARTRQNPKSTKVRQSASGDSIFSLPASIVTSVKKAVLTNADVLRFMNRHAPVFAFLKRRLNRKQFSGLGLTFLLLAFAYTALLLIKVATGIISSGPITAADIRAANLFYAFRNAKLIAFFSWVTLLGNWQIIFGATVMMTLILWLWRKRMYLMPLWISLIGNEVLTWLLKLALQRPRPAVAYYLQESFSFPSGHASLAVAFYGFLTYLIWRETKKWSVKIAALVGGITIVLAVGLSRLYLGAHYLSDVLGGYLLGLLLLMVGVGLAEWTQYRRPNT